MMDTSKAKIDIKRQGKKYGNLQNSIHILVTSASTVKEKQFYGYEIEKGDIKSNRYCYLPKRDLLEKILGYFSAGCKACA